MGMHESIYANLKAIAADHERIIPVEFDDKRLDFVLEDRDRISKPVRGRILYEFTTRPGYVLEIVKACRAAAADRG